MRVVLTGAPGTGKSIILSCLARKGWVVLPEAFRWRAMALSISSRHDNVRAQHLSLYAIQQFLEDVCIPSSCEVCFDRCTVDLIAYERFYGGSDPRPEIMDLGRACSRRIDAAYFSALDPAQYVTDWLRDESAPSALGLQKTILTTYEEFGVPLYELPLATETERADYIIRRGHQNHREL